MTLAHGDDLKIVIGNIVAYFAQQSVIDKQTIKNLQDQNKVLQDQVSALQTEVNEDLQEEAVVKDEIKSLLQKLNFSEEEINNLLTVTSTSEPEPEPVTAT